MIHNSMLWSETEASTAGDPATPVSFTSTAASLETLGGYDPFLEAVCAPDAEIDPMLAFDNAYWASQPAAVQLLRTLQNPEQRSEYAERLASEGHKIDVQIMVWGWDPSVVNRMRQTDGCTCVPSADRHPIEVSTGFGVLDALAGYYPNNSPFDSIAV